VHPEKDQGRIDPMMVVEEAVVEGEAEAAVLEVEEGMVMGLSGEIRATSSVSNAISMGIMQTGAQVRRRKMKRRKKRLIMLEQSSSSPLCC
jgi:hypothetical protein